MELLYFLILGLVQGITEFLPVSSSGHLLLIGRIIGYTPSIAFEITAHLGTLLAVVTAYRGTLKERISKPFSKPSLILIVTTLVTAAIIFVFEKPIKATFDGSVLPFTFLLSAALIVISSSVKPKAGKKIGFFEGFVIGVTQAAAALPGLSRSGTTISAARMLKVGSEESADFSFLLSIPIIVVSAVGEFVLHTDAFLGENLLGLAIGFAASFVSGLLAIKLVLRCIRGGGWQIFAVYLAALGIFMFINDFFLHVI
ncbi:MAG: undecaprenyl-diphosphate phosphatase [Clostridia bacterium]|nr:undecaprenyl-diphosphate phosphatase [Clostridia bacterium]